MPWFRTVLKAARLAVRILGMLSDEARASRLSFADVVKRLAVGCFLVDSVCGFVAGCAVCAFVCDVRLLRLGFWLGPGCCNQYRINKAVNFQQCYILASVASVPLPTGVEPPTSAGAARDRPSLCVQAP